MLEPSTIIRWRRRGAILVAAEVIEVEGDKGGGTGRRPLPLILTEDERREGHRRWVAGDRSGLVRVAEREYQRVSRRKRYAAEKAAREEEAP